MKNRIPEILLLLLLLPQLILAQSSQETIVGNKHTIHSDILNETREYWVGLPDSYDHVTVQNKRYPLLLVLDGPSHFRYITGMLSSMSAMRYGTRRIPEMIVVGLASTNCERDFTPDKIVTKRKNDTGGADQFLDFVEDELLPELQEKYQLSEYSILFGHSLGGLFAVHTYLQEESNFDALLAIDPSFGTWDAEKIDAKIEAMSDRSFDRYLYIATANWGTRNLGNRDRHVRFFEALRKRNGSDLFRARLEYFENEN
ncbi:MAG: alpha/beta hydrolase-fold protein [Gracilimonas sp.]|uniref:alpha/beta hydrolase n=1 Tax=Gracilimonas sp. TaxID=1974203 RepID=UPI0037531376|nr:alpha/beta hydrolase-fold protein [Gracilimonas sp.]